MKVANGCPFGFNYVTLPEERDSLCHAECNEASRPS